MSKFQNCSTVSELIYFLEYAWPIYATIIMATDALLATVIQNVKY